MGLERTLYNLVAQSWDDRVLLDLCTQMYRLWNLRYEGFSLSGVGLTLVKRFPTTVHRWMAPLGFRIVESDIAPKYPPHTQGFFNSLRVEVCTSAFPKVSC